MSQATTLNLQPLDKKFRNKLERTVKEARDVAEEAAWAACEQLGVGLAKPDAHLGVEEKDLRRRLRIHGRQLGDKRDAKGEQELERLVEEIAYEHWHRMLFARFLAENHLLMYPDPDDPVSVSIEDCEELAADEGAKNGWELAARFAARMLPQIFRTDSPVFSLALPPEGQQQLERLLSDLSDEVFTASDSLGWVYQFWQAKRKVEVNKSEVKIGARELPAVTQLFTEPYMVSFLLDNSLGAWWAARRLSDDELSNAASEQELRDKASLPGVPLDYLRFVKVEESGRWEPAAGTFDAWPERLSELKTLDPCCGSGHFLVAALLMLVPMRMDLEGLPARDAVDRVLTENLHGLEIDQRCVELAAFALALTAWRFPEAGGYRPLPDLNVACCGLSVSVAKEEWKKLAKDNNQLKIALDWMYDEFKDAPVLGSLLNPAKSMAAKVVEWEKLQPILDDALTGLGSEEILEVAVVAHGLTRASMFLSEKYDLVATNVPYLGRGLQSNRMRTACDTSYAVANKDLATVFLCRMRDFLSSRGLVAAVVPSNWMFLPTYEPFRNWVLSNCSLNLVALLGGGGEAFAIGPGSIVNVGLLSFHQRPPNPDAFFRGLTVEDLPTPESKADNLAKKQLTYRPISEQSQNPDCRITIHSIAGGELLRKFVETTSGLKTGDMDSFGRRFWEVDTHSGDWEHLQRTNKQTALFSGFTDVIHWEKGRGRLANLAQSLKHLNHVVQNWRRGQDVWGHHGVAVSAIGNVRVARYLGHRFDSGLAVVTPEEQSHLPALWAYMSSDQYERDLRKIDTKLAITTATLAKVPFDLAHWQQVASEKYPHGLPEPYSDDPTQWIFHGHPASSTDALQVAVARLLGYRWPAEMDAEMELATDARAWLEQSSQLKDLADNDGIVCIPAVGTEQPAEDRLLNLLHKAYEDGRAQEQVFMEKLKAGDENDPVTLDLWRRGYEPSLPDSFPAWRDSLLEAVGHTGKTLKSWLRDKFFTQHCKLFHHRPFIWHIWDGLKDGFSVLINYHKLDNKLLETLIYTYLNDWINRQKRDRDAGVDGSEEKLAAAEWLKERLEWILEGESPNDIFVRWKSLEEQSIGWNPDINDGVRLNIRPWMTVDDAGKKGAGLLRDKPNIHWKKDRGKDVESAPWYDLGPEYGGKQADRINEHSLTLEEKQAARKEAGAVT